jgi:uracil-DNA glycosylase family 4
MPLNDRHKSRRLIIDRLESLQRAGVLQLPKGRAVAKTSRTEEISLTAIRPVELPTTIASSDPPTLNKAATIRKSGGWQPLGAGELFGSDDSAAKTISTAASLPVLQQEVAGCTRCEELARTRTQTVFGVGDPDARLCFVGEAPGADEDRLGEPFVGRAGQLLTKIIEACRMKREEVYILNMIKCRPPGNRNPLPDELANCRSYLDRQLALIRPEFLCCLGAVAAQNLLGTTLSIGKLRGKVHTCRGAKLVCTYHPAYLLRNPSAKKDTWDDLKLLLREMGVEL